MRVQPTPPAEGPRLPEAEQRRLAAAASRSATRSSVEFVEEFVVLSGRAWRILWLTVLLLIVANAAVLALFTILYSQSNRVDSLLWFLRSFFVVSEVNAFLAANGTRIAGGYGFLSVTFSMIAVRMVVRAIQRSLARRGNRNPATSRRSHGRSAATRTRSMVQQSTLYCPERVRRKIARWRQAIGVRGAYFDTRLLVEEWLELATQTLAAHSASKSISNVPLNLTYAGIIFANSISTLVMAWVFPKSLIKQRLACVIADLVLDFLWGTLLPVWMYVPVVKLYWHRSTILEDLTDYSGFTRAAQRILVTSWKSYALSIVPFGSSLLKLLDLQSILRDLMPRQKRGANAGAGYESWSRFRVGRQKHGWATRVTHALMPIYGIAVLFTSLTANEVFSSFTKQAAVACGYRVHPWFSMEEACLQRKVNCTTLGLGGRAAELDAILDGFDSESLAELYFLDCPALEISSSIRQFKYLMSIVVSNSTIVSWRESGGLSDAFFVDLRNVHMYDVQFGEDPVGFTGFATRTLEWVHLQNVDGDRILSLVGNQWHNLQAFGCQSCNLTEFPEIMYAFTRLEVFSLALNDLASVPNDWLDGTSLRLQMIWFDGNLRLAELPDSLWRQSATAGIFSVAYTNLSVVPDWVADVAFPGFRATVIGTPICDGGVVLSPRAEAITSCSSVF